MYLDFVKDIFHPSDNITINYGDGEQLSGIIVKLSSEMIAIKTKEGRIVIIKDDDITNISLEANASKSINDERENTSIITNDIGHTKQNREYTANITIGEQEKEWDSIDSELLITHVYSLKRTLIDSERDKVFASNAKVIESLKHSVVILKDDLQLKRSSCGRRPYEDHVVRALCVNLWGLTLV